MKRMQGKDAEKLLSQWEKGAKFNFKIKAQVHERCFFFMKWNVICNAEDRFSCVRAFCRASHVRASMHRITSLELLSTLMMCLVQLSKWRECKAKDAEKLLSQWEKVANELFCRASNVRASMHRITGLDLLRTLMLLELRTHAVFSATKQEENARMRECKERLLKAFLSERKVLNAILRVTAQVHERCFFLNEMLFAMQKTDFHV